MSAEKNDVEIYRCSGCRCRYLASDFFVDRLGKRRKTCIRCHAREQVPERMKMKQVYAERSRRARLHDASARLPAPAIWLSDEDIEALLS